MSHAFVPVRNDMLVENYKRMGCSGQEQHVLIEERLYSECTLLMLLCLLVLTCCS